MIIKMQIESIDIKNDYYFCGTRSGIDGVVHTKQLKSLSIVQSKIGSYGIKLGDGEEYNTGEGGIFIAPPLVTQKITHHENPQLKEFKMRFIFIDVVINQKYRIDELFDFPAVADKTATGHFDKAFDFLDKTDNLCDKMSCIYQIVKHLLEISEEKTNVGEMYPLMDFIGKNYMKNISVGDMARVMNMSESNLYAVFKKTFGTSPVKYLNNYRLSAASEQLLKSDDSIQNIAESVGICDRFYFSKIFKAKYRLSPQQYRKKTEAFL